MQVDQSEGTKEIPRIVEVLARSTTSNKTGHQTHQWNLIFHQSKGQKAMIRQKVRERLTVWETSRNGNRMSSKARLSQLQWKKQTCFAMELETSWWWGFSSLALQKRSDWSPKEYSTWTCSQTIICSKVMYWWKETVRNGATWSLQFCHRNTCRITALPWFKAFGWTSEHLLLAWPLFSDLV